MIHNNEIITLSCNEQVDLEIIIPRDCRGVIAGIVVDKHGDPIEDAVVKLFEVLSYDCKKPKLCPLTHTFTDCTGYFLFGPLSDKKKYMIKVWHNSTTVKCPRTIHPFCNSYTIASHCDDIKEYILERERIDIIDDMDMNNNIDMNDIDYTEEEEEEEELLDDLVIIS